jgi:hypothetical protein
MYRSSYVLAHFNGEYVYFLKQSYNTLHVRKKTIYCPCKVCKNNMMFKHREVIHEHMIQSGFIDNYFFWTKDSETTEDRKHRRLEGRREHGYSRCRV